MQKIKGIKIEPDLNDVGRYWVHFPTGYSFNMSESEILNPDVNTQVKRNLRQAFKLGNYGNVDTAEFKNGINSILGGIETAAGKVFLTSNLTHLGDGWYEIGFSSKSDSIAVIITVHEQELIGELDEFARCETVLANIASFLRISKAASLTTSALNSIKNREFWW